MEKASEQLSSSCFMASYEGNMLCSVRINDGFGEMNYVLGIFAVFVVLACME